MYINKTNKLLKDGNTYSIMNYNPMNKVLASLKKFCEKLLDNEYEIK